MTTTHTGTTVVLPSLGENVTEATVTRWLKAPGDRVEHNEHCSKSPPTKSTPRSRYPPPAFS
jgi:hypothetical protein